MGQVVSSIKPWVSSIDRHSRVHLLDPHIVAGVVYQESAGNPFAIRPEPGFWKRYLANINALFLRTSSKWDNHWGKYPELASASYGLMQILYVVAVEHGATLRYPTELCDPDINLDLGCKHLRQKMVQANFDIRKGLLRYNGGGDPSYPDKILSHSRKIRDARLFSEGK